MNEVGNVFGGALDGCTTFLFIVIGVFVLLFLMAIFLPPPGDK